MKKIVVILSLVGLFVGCTMNPSKEERIRKLETEVQVTLKKVEELEVSVNILQTKNKELELRINELEQQ